MSYGLERLKEIGAQKIHERTHISRDHVQALLHESFDGFTKIHFLGFISILEREYNVDLSDLKAKGMAYFKEISSKPQRINNTVFSQGKKKKNNTLPYIILALILFGSFSYFKLIPSMDENTQVKQIDNSLIENAQKNIEPAIAISVEDSNESNETQSSEAENNSSVVNAVQNIKDQAPKEEIQKVDISKSQLQEVSKSLKIIPKTKVWMGYIEIKTNQRNQKSFEGEFDLDAKKDWLLLFGHGNIALEVDGVHQEFNSSQNIRFKYVDGKLSEISSEEFQQLNRDKKW